MKLLRSLLVVALLAGSLFAAAAPAPWAAHGRLRVSADGRTLQHADGTPFFWLADTAWHLRSLAPSDLDVYLRDRAAKRFNVVMANFMHGGSGLKSTKPHPKIEFDPAWWAHNDRMVDEAAKHGLYVVVIAGWGTQFRGFATDMPRLMHDYGRQIGERYKDRPNVMYFVAAEFYKIKQQPPPRAFDDLPLTADQIAWYDQLGRGLRAGDPHALISIHGFPDQPGMKQPSIGQAAFYYQRADWCDFYANQSHNFQEQIRPMTLLDWDLTNPTKPTVNAEGGYEQCNPEIHPWLKDKPSVAIFDSGWGQRFQAYWGVFFGGFGFAYGNDYLWDMKDPQGNKGVLHRPALEAPGAKSMAHLRALMEPRIATARPDAALLLSDPGTDVGSDTSAPPDLRCATRDRDSRWAMIYTTVGKEFTVNLARLRGPELIARWFDPRDGTYREAGRFPATGAREFDPPGPVGKECDWVLVLDSVTPAR
jgi:hypothetical protein